MGNWYDGVRLERYCDETRSDEIGCIKAMEHAAITGRSAPLQQFSRDGRFRGNSMRRALQALIEETGGRVATRHVDSVKKRHRVHGTYVVVWPRGVAEVRPGHVHFAADDAALFERVARWSEHWILPQKAAPGGAVYAIVSTARGYAVSHIGVVDSPLVRDNYTDEVLAGYDHVLADLSASDPCGRISIFDGPPGCGKSYMLRALINGARNSMMVLVPPQIVAHLNGPEFLNTLLQTSVHAGNVTLVLEDADACVAARRTDNMGSISTLLNLGDGIVGSMLNLRIVLTTNAPELELDAAIRRPGRLCRRVHVGPLARAHAFGVYSRLVRQAGSHDQFHELAARREQEAALGGVEWSATLAEVYRAAHDAKQAARAAAPTRAAETATA